MYIYSRKHYFSLIGLTLQRLNQFENICIIAHVQVKSIINIANSFYYLFKNQNLQISYVKCVEKIHILSNCERIKRIYTVRRASADNFSSFFTLPPALGTFLEPS